MAVSMAGVGLVTVSLIKLIIFLKLEGRNTLKFVTSSPSLGKMLISRKIIIYKYQARLKKLLPKDTFMLILQ
jgi:hypothetical protein